ncbi:UDP-N-acetylmuramate--L-alanine ligase [Sphingomicrobium sediminis]|uniref:Mur ligase family protein n=1 Tax=Sphingomicrobium sediminis TaxID=2950949 RepID=A0A9X2J212_9SPHN|nr:Mur ligase family protein [Sphingomicrobium sediminis]MCM8557319.1 Mur ligase family protein [Sphingomicrobium sediminis]
MNKNYFFCGIGGSGMLPLAAIIKARGADVSGSDRSLDAGRMSSKFDYLRRLGIDLYEQDGTGLKDGQVLVASAAVEDTVPDMVRAEELGLTRRTRPELLADLLNEAATSIAIGGTSGKSTVTGMTAWILHEAGRDPTAMNGAVMKNFATPEAPFASALVGDPDLFVSEVDESDGSIALYRPTVALVNNISLDHKSMEELRQLFGDFLRAGNKAIYNADDAEARGIAPDDALGFGFADDADYRASDLTEDAHQTRLTLHHQDDALAVTVPMPGRHNAMNGLAAIAAAHQAGVELPVAIAALASFAGLKRRYELVGEAAGVAVIDDFGHNPDKAAATLRTARATGRRLHIMFQPHGYGPLKQMGDELAEVFADLMDKNDRLYVPDPVYQGGTVNRERGGAWLAAEVKRHGGNAVHHPDREALAAMILEDVGEGDMILVMGARDDSLIAYAHDFVTKLEERA